MVRKCIQIKTWQHSFRGLYSLVWPGNFQEINSVYENCGAMPKEELCYCHHCHTFCIHAVMSEGRILKCDIYMPRLFHGLVLRYRR